MKRSALLVVVLVFSSALIFAAGSKEGAQAGSTAKVGGSVSVLAVWGGQELDIFNSLV